VLEYLHQPRLLGARGRAVVVVPGHCSSKRKGERYVMVRIYSVPFIAMS
jgi:hypothetical protein